MQSKIPFIAKSHVIRGNFSCNLQSNATMTNKEPFKLQRGFHTQATCFAMLRKVEGRSTVLVTRNATIAVTKWGATREFFLAKKMRCKLQEKLPRVTWP